MSCNLGCGLCAGVATSDHNRQCCQGRACGPRGNLAPTITWDETYTPATNFTTYTAPNTTGTVGTGFIRTEVTYEQWGSDEPIRTRVSQPREVTWDVNVMQADQERSRVRRNELLARLRAEQTARLGAFEEPARVQRTLSSDPEAPKVDTEQVAKKKLAKLAKQNELEVEVKPQKEATPVVHVPVLPEN